MNKKVISKITSGVLLCTMLAYTTPVLAFTKDETVYSKIDSNGNNYNTIVNDHIINDEQEQLINDISDLLNIKNVNGDEEFSQDGNNLAWHAEESDIYYQGESQKELPIECNVKYELDGNEITASELVGKNGKVKITIEYINKDAHTVNINGKDQTLRDWRSCGTQPFAGDSQYDFGTLRPAVCLWARAGSGGRYGSLSGPGQGGRLWRV